MKVANSPKCFGCDRTLPKFTHTVWPRNTMCGNLGEDVIFSNETGDPTHLNGWPILKITRRTREEDGTIRRYSVWLGEMGYRPGTNFCTGDCARRWAETFAKLARGRPDYRIDHRPTLAGTLLAPQAE